MIIRFNLHQIFINFPKYFQEEKRNIIFLLVQIVIFVLQCVTSSHNSPSMYQDFEIVSDCPLH